MHYQKDKMINPNNYIRVFGGPGMPYITSYMFIKYYDYVDPLITWKDDHWTVFLRKDIVKKISDEGVNFYSNKKKVKAFKKDYEKHLKTSIPLFNSIINKKKITKKDVETFLECAGETLTLYVKCEFFFTEKAFEILGDKIKGFDKLKNPGRKQINRVYFNTDSFIYKLLTALSKQFSIPFQELLYYSSVEILNLFEHKTVDIKELSKRRKQHILVRDNSRIQILLDKKYDKIIDKMIPPIKPKKELTGKIGNKGIYTGKVKLFNHGYQFYKVPKLTEEMNKGDVLVTETTSPELTVACHKAGAIVTNEGGLLSHAAIISREMNKPCIVGAHGITSSVKDGDTIEVNANKGTVKVLKKENILKELKKANKQPWHLIINRPGIPPLHFTVTFQSFQRMGKVLGTDWTMEDFKWQDSKFYVSEKDKQKMLRFFDEKLSKDKDFILRLLKQGEKECNNLMKESAKYEKNHYDYFKKLFELQKSAAPYFRIDLKLEILLHKRFPDIKFLPPIKMNFIMKFHNELIKLSKIKDAKQGIKKLVKEYGWLTVFHYTGRWMTAEDVKEKLIPASQEKKVPPPPKDTLLKIYRYAIFLRTHLAETFAYSNAQAKPLLERIASDFGISYEDITYLSGDELLASLKKKELVVSKEEIASRRRRFGFFIYKRKLHILNEKECKYIFGKKKEEKKKAQVLKGIPASPGNIKGKVCLVKNFLDFSKFKPNDILVAYSTTPNYIVLMHMAKAFLTQEGGITSHAAIVSRELKKPCIVGIKNIMKELKDGDLVEIDAYKGVIKKLK
ncbi:hypothetical protein HQ533_06540 [Candidatus Woesearchaeota archaeon]|nr:hypothetical protein [Candidatus Woesearchaeota archaeon]